MRINLHVAFVVYGAATVGIVTGCASGGSQDPSASTPARTQIFSVRSQSLERGFVNVAGVNAPGGNQVIVSDSQNNTVSVFGSTGQLNALLTTGLSQPSGLATDVSETLYVANAQNFNVLVYPKPYTAPSRTLADPGYFPDDVAVSTKGVVAVMNIVANPYGPGAVRLYARDSNAACATVTDPNWQGMQFGAFDAAGDLFFDGYDRNGNPLIGEILGGCSAASIETLTVKTTFANPQGVGVLNGKVLVLDQNYNSFSPVIYSYAAPSGGSLGAPTATTKLSAGIEMMTFALTKTGRNLWIAHSDEAAGRIEYGYPDGHFVKSYNESGLATAFGIAVNPVASP